MRALYIIVPILGILVIAYRYYSAFISARLWVLNDERATPAHLKADGANYFPTSRWVLFILIVAMAGLGLAVVNALADSAWATFTVFMTIPLALVMGFYMFRWRIGAVKEATIVGVTIACGAISGFHVLVSTGTTSKMVDRESDIRPIGYGAMLMEGIVGVVAIITAASLSPSDYYAINTT